MGWVFGVLFGHGCEPWERDEVAVVDGVEVDASTLAGAAGTVRGRPITWAVHAGVDLFEQIAALAQVELHERNDEERQWLPELWARVPLGLRADALCARMRSPTQAPCTVSAALTLATLAHCPDAWDARPAGIQLQPRALEIIQPLVMPLGYSSRYSTMALDSARPAR